MGIKLFSKQGFMELFTIACRRATFAVNGIGNSTVFLLFYFDSYFLLVYGTTGMVENFKTRALTHFPLSSFLKLENSSTWPPVESY